MKTLQEIFDAIWNHYITNKEPAAVIKNSERHYILDHILMKDGKELKSPAGLFFVNGRYNSIMNAFDLNALISNKVFNFIDDPEFPKDLLPQTYSLIATATGIHDRTAFYEGEEFLSIMRKELTSLASSFNLVLPAETKPEPVEPPQPEQECLTSTSQ